MCFPLFLILVCSCLCGLAYCSYKYVNPHKLIFIFGKKGSGKSTYMISLMLHHLKRGWNVYTNMGDVCIPGVRVFPIDQLKTCAPEPHSVLFVDEGGLIWDNRGFKSFDKGYTEFFKLQRKYKCKVYINSQDFDIDKKIRQLTDSMVLMILLPVVLVLFVLFFARLLLWKLLPTVKAVLQTILNSALFSSIAFFGFLSTSSILIAIKPLSAHPLILPPFRGTYPPLFLKAR